MMVVKELKSLRTEVMVEIPRRWEDVRQAIAANVGVAFFIAGLVNLNINVLSVGFRVTLGRNYQFVGIGAFGASLGIAHYGRRVWLR
jgi:long-subunit acyl-CoA synthetase (AMP-forming)